MKSPRFKPLRAAFLLSILALVALVVAGCGGGGDEEDAQATIDKAFSTSIDSANVALAFDVQVDGVAQLQEPVQVKLSGPFQSNGNEKLPSLDWDASFSGGGQSITGGLVSTGDEVYVNFQNEDYEVPKAQVDQINQQLAAQGGQNQSLSDLGVDPKSWLTDAETVGDEEVNGADTTHVTAGVDVAKMLEDLNSVAEQAGGAMGTSAPQQLTPEQIQQINDVVQDPTIDVYVAKDDDTLRRLNLEISFEIPEDQRAQLQGATGGSVKFSIDFSDVGQEQTIEPPADARPLNELQGALGGIGGGGTTVPEAPSGSGGSGSGGGGGGGGSGSSPDAQALQEYSACLQKVDPADSAALQECQKLLE